MTTKKHIKIEIMTRQKDIWNCDECGGFFGKHDMSFIGKNGEICGNCHDEESANPEHLIQYSSAIENLFRQYLKCEINKSTLIDKLYEIEQYHQDSVEHEELEGDLWFKFGKDDNLCTTIANLDLDLSDGDKNKKFTEQRMIDCLSLECYEKGNDLKIYYS